MLEAVYVNIRTRYPNEDEIAACVPCERQGSHYLLSEVAEVGNRFKIEIGHASGNVCVFIGSRNVCIFI